MQAFERLEREFGEWVDRSHMVACSSGTTALHLALEALQLPLGSEVLVPEFTMVACARAVVMAGLKPVFVDCNDDLLMDPNLCIQRITPTTRAIMPVHVYGRRCDMDSIASIASEHGLKIVEDCAEYHGGILCDRADASCWSFYRTKIVGGEEGGMIAFRDEKHADLARCLRCQGFTDDHDFVHVPRGINARMSNVNAELVLQSLGRVEENLAYRQGIERWYDRHVPGWWRMPLREVCWVYDLLLPPDVSVRRVVKEMNRCGIDARHAFAPMSQQPEFYDPNFTRLNAHRMSQQIMYLPVRPDMEEDELLDIVGLLTRIAIA